MDDSSVYSFGRLNQCGTHGAHPGLDPKLHPWGGQPKQRPYYVLFASGKEPELVETGKDQRKRVQRRLKPRWSQSLNTWVRAMALTQNALVVAGVPDPFGSGDTDGDPFAGDKPGRLHFLSTGDGKQLAEQSLTAPPVWDGLAAARGGLYVATTDGEVTCLRG